MDDINQGRVDRSSGLDVEAIGDPTTVPGLIGKSSMTNTCALPTSINFHAMSKVNNLKSDPTF